MAKMARKMKRGMSCGMDDDMDDDTEEMEDEDEGSKKSPKRRVTKTTVEESFAKGGAVRSRGRGLQQVSGFKFSGTF